MDSNDLVITYFPSENTFFRLFPSENHVFCIWRKVDILLLYLWFVAISIRGGIYSDKIRQTATPLMVLSYSHGRQEFRTPPGLEHKSSLSCRPPYHSQPGWKAREALSKLDRWKAQAPHNGAVVWAREKTALVSLSDVGRFRHFQAGHPIIYIPYALHVA